MATMTRNNGGFTLNQGQPFTDPNGNTGIVNYDTATGARLSAGQSTGINQEPRTWDSLNNNPPESPKVSNTPSSGTHTPQEIVLAIMKDLQGTQQEGTKKLLGQQNQIKSIGFGLQDKALANTAMTPTAQTASFNAAPDAVNEGVLSNNQQIQLGNQAYGNANDTLKTSLGEYDKEQERVHQIAQDAADLAYKNAVLEETKRSNKANESINSQKTTASHILSPADAASLGVPYGTTQEQASSMGLTPTKPMTEAQAKDQTYALRADTSNETISNLESTVASMNSLKYLADTFSENSTVGNKFASPEIKQLKQAERDFITSVLRRESGASISTSEFATANKQYFPQPGDDSKTIQQKAVNRDNAIKSFQIGSGQKQTNIASGKISSGNSYTITKTP